MSAGIVIDATADPDLPSQELFNAMRERYWVCAFKSGDSRVSMDSWLWSAERPRDVPNGMMAWRRPTFGEFCAFVSAWHAGRRPDGHLATYRRTQPAPPLCRCGHGEDSHRYFGCRSTCVCTSFARATPPVGEQGGTE